MTTSELLYALSILTIGTKISVEVNVGNVKLSFEVANDDVNDLYVIQKLIDSSNN